ncbi:hypothetical protein DH2020_039943 [Rehmannia glutinosa]|uniref:Protein kinase domain-containing protein n=1 Tax=Rehmannia glutinosa TaxID=99300 RepID=A0ABR0UV23_REHGL
MDLHFSFLIIFSTSLLFTLSATTTAAANDTAALSIFRFQTDLHGALLSNWTTTTAASTACAANWFGIKCTNHRVTAVSLPSLNLRGPIAALASLDQLRLLELRDNRLNGTLAPIANCVNLKHVYLSGNDFSGEIPPELSSLHRLLRLDLSNNNLRGPIPTQLSNLSRLLTLRLENNEISGTIPNFFNSLPNLKDLNLSNNELQGTLQNSLLSRYGGVPSPETKATNQTTRIQWRRVNLGKGAAIRARREFTPTTMEAVEIVMFELEDLLRASAEMLGKGSLGTVYKVVLEDGSTVAVKRLKDANPCARKEFEQYMDVIGKVRHGNVVRFRAYYYAREEKLLVYDYLPNGSLHSLLHAEDQENTFRLDHKNQLDTRVRPWPCKNPQRVWRFKNPHGNIKSSNILLDKNGIACVSDFGLSLLLNPVHAIAKLGGYRAPEQSETKRLSQKADVYSFGVLLLEVLTGRAPSGHPPTAHQEEPAVDLPKWVSSVVRDEWTAEVFDQELLRYKNIEEELVSMLHVAMACVVARPEKRPTMVEVVRMIEEIRVEQSPVGEEYDESRSSLSPSLATTEDA